MGHSFKKLQKGDEAMHKHDVAERTRSATRIDTATVDTKVSSEPERDHRPPMGSLSRVAPKLHFLEVCFALSLRVAVSRTRK